MSPQRFALPSEVSLILIRDGQLLLLRRFQTGYEDGKYCYIAGHKEANETATQAMIREAQEEAGITLQPQNLVMAHVMHRKDHDERIAFFFTAKQFEGEPRNLEPEKHDEMRWFPISALPETMIPYMRFAFEQVQQGKTYSEFGWPSPPAPPPQGRGAQLKM